MALADNRTARYVALAGLLAVIAGPGASSAWAYDDGYENVFSSVLTAVGVMPQDRTPEIQYRERPPLVLPPKAQLVKPVAPGAARPASWPQDQDELRRKQEADKSRIPVIDAFDRQDERRPLSKEETMRHRAAEAGAQTTDAEYCRLSEHSDGHCRVSAAELKAEGDRFRAANPDDTDVVTAGIEPERKYLTEPPSGYRKPTKTVKATHEAPVNERDQSNPLSGILHIPKADDESPN